MEQQPVIFRHLFVGDTHQLPEHFPRRLGDADSVAQALAHLLDAVEACQDGEHHGHLLVLALLVLEIATDEDIEELVGASEFNIRLDHHRIPSLHDRVLDLMGAHGKSLVDPLSKILAL